MKARDISIQDLAFIKQTIAADERASQDAVLEFLTLRTSAENEPEADRKKTQTAEEVAMWRDYDVNGAQFNIGADLEEEERCQIEREMVDSGIWNAEVMARALEGVHTDTDENEEDVDELLAEVLANIREYSHAYNSSFCYSSGLFATELDEPAVNDILASEGLDEAPASAPTSAEWYPYDSKMVFQQFSRATPFSESCDRCFCSIHSIISLDSGYLTHS
jgi:hypothetical protein